MYYKLYNAIRERMLYVWNVLVDELKDDYEQLYSCNRDMSRYLVPKGTKDQVTYYGKPECSLRISDHWSWYSSVKKCEDPDIVQCPNVMFRPNPRNEEGMASTPIEAIQICFYANGEYMPLIGIMNERGLGYNYIVDKDIPIFINEVKELIAKYRANEE